MSIAPPVVLPLTYGECRARFQRTCDAAGAERTVWPITARGPHGEELTVESTWRGSTSPDRVLIVMSGVHGVEGFIGSALQCDLLSRLPESMPDGMALLVIHSVNPWGMAWWRRQNESNVDLNRNWRRSEVEPMHNDAYDELHPLACPDTPGLPRTDELLEQAMGLVERKGLDWVRNGITAGQYRHQDGLHFGGDRTEESTSILARIVSQQVVGAERVFTLDLHTGHGPFGTVTALSDQPQGSEQDRFLASVVGRDRVEATVANPDATTGAKSGQLANGFADLLGGARAYATSVEFGTAADTEQLLATIAEQWVHRHGDRADPDHAATIWNYRTCFTPDDQDWVDASMRQGREVLDAAVDVVAGWTDDGP